MHVALARVIILIFYRQRYVLVFIYFNIILRRIIMFVILLLNALRQIGNSMVERLYSKIKYGPHYLIWELVDILLCSASRVLKCGYQRGRDLRRFYW